MAKWLKFTWYSRTKNDGLGIRMCALRSARDAFMCASHSETATGIIVRNTFYRVSECIVVPVRIALSLVGVLMLSGLLLLLLLLLLCRFVCAFSPIRIWFYTEAEPNCVKNCCINKAPINSCHQCSGVRYLGWRVSLSVNAIRFAFEPMRLLPQWSTGKKPWTAQTSTHSVRVKSCATEIPYKSQILGRKKVPGDSMIAEYARARSLFRPRRSHLGCSRLLDPLQIKYVMNIYSESSLIFSNRPFILFFLWSVAHTSSSHLNRLGSNCFVACALWSARPPIVRPIDPQNVHLNNGYLWVYIAIGWSDPFVSATMRSAP